MVPRDGTLLGSLVEPAFPAVPNAFKGPAPCGPRV